MGVVGVQLGVVRQGFRHRGSRPLIQAALEFRDVERGLAAEHGTNAHGHQNQAGRADQRKASEARADEGQAPGSGGLAGRWGASERGHGRAGDDADRIGESARRRWCRPTPIAAWAIQATMAMVRGTG